jgi:RNA polymerase sigma-B factor
VIILAMRFFGEMTQTEIANHVGLSQMHVSRLPSRALAQLRRQLVADWPTQDAELCPATRSRPC